MPAEAGPHLHYTCPAVARKAFRSFRTGSFEVWKIDRDSTMQKQHSPSTEGWSSDLCVIWTAVCTGCFYTRAATPQTQNPPQTTPLVRNVSWPEGEATENLGVAGGRGQCLYQGGRAPLASP